MMVERFALCINGHLENHGSTHYFRREQSSFDLAMLQHQRYASQLGQAKIEGKGWYLFLNNAEIIEISLKNSFQ
jgi:hypothetical protein